MTKIWFKLTYSLAGMSLAKPIDAPVSVPLPADGNAEILLWLRTFEKQKSISPQLCCDAVIKREIKPDVAEMFDSLFKSVLPRDKSTKIELPYRLSLDAVIDSAGNIPGKLLVPLSIMPVKFKNIHREIYKILSNLTNKFVRTLRWSQVASGPHSPFRFVGFYWSKNKSHWNSMPSTLYARMKVLKGIDIGTKAIRDLETIWLSGEEEPLGHELVREAFDIAGTSPRSALLIAVSALETSLKNHISFRVPNAHIILDEIPSPPIIKMTQEVISRLDKTAGIVNSIFPLKENDKNTLQKWIAQRNQVAHGTKKTVNVDHPARLS